VFVRHGILEEKRSLQRRWLTEASGRYRCLVKAIRNQDAALMYPLHVKSRSLPLENTSTGALGGLLLEMRELVILLGTRPAKHNSKMT